MRGVVYCDACGCSNPSGLKKCQTCSATMNVVRSNPITSADFANRKMAIFDIDNTILDPEQRFIDARRAGIIDKDGAPKSKGGWKKRGEFLYKEDRLLKDRVMDNSMDLIEHLMESGYVIAYCTARPFAHYEATKYQLEQKGFPLFQNGAGEDLLFCKRSMGQKTPLYKKGVVETLQAQYDVRLFFDDKPENLAAALQADVPGVYASVQEYYGMIKGVRSNSHTVEDPEPHGFYAPKPYDQDKADADERKNPSMYSKKSLEMAYESIKGTKIQTEPGPGMKMCGTCVYMCQKSAKCKKWTEIKGEPVYVVADWYCKAYKMRTRNNPKGRFLDGEAATMVFVKPRGLNAWLDIKRMLPGPIMKKRWIKIDKDLISAHYAEHAHKPHFSKLVDYYDGTWVLALVVSARYDAVRAVIGSSKPDQLKQGDIRKAILDKYGDSSYGLLEDWTSGVDNGIHASDSVEAADRELELWFGRKPDKQPKFLNMSSHPVEKKNDGGFHPFVGLTVPVDDWNKSVEMMVDFYEGMPWLPKWIQGKEPPIILVGGVTIIVLLAPYVFKAIVGKEPTVQGGNPFNENDPLPEAQRLHLNKLVEDLRRRRPSLMNPRKNPVKRGSDSKGSYYRWGKNQKYYYKTGSKTSRENARKKAHNQAKAAFAGGYQGKYNPGHGGGIPDEIEGKHCILELYDCDPKLLNDEKFIRKTMKSAAKGANMQLLDFVSHEFDPQGVTALALLGESHMSIHTWPELGYAMVDVLTCGEKSRPEEACEIICKKLQADNHTLKLFMRETPAYHEMARQNPEEYSSDYMVPRDVDTLGKAADRIEDTYYEGLEVPEWWKSKMSVTADKADSLADAISYVADNPSQILKIYSGEPKSKFRNMGVVFAEVQIGRNIAKDVGEVVQSVYRGLIGGRTSMAERRMAMAIASMQKELSDRATDAGGNAIANLKVDYEIVQGTATLTIIAHADAIKMARKPKSNPPRSNPPKSKVDKGKELYKHMNGKDPAKTETKTIDIGDVWYQVGEGGCWEIGYMSGKETGSSSQKYRHTFNEETKNGDFPKLYATIPDKGKPMLIITGGTWKIKTDEDGVAWIYD